MDAQDSFGPVTTVNGAHAAAGPRPAVGTSRLTALPSVAVALRYAALGALAMSTQYLVQPFVWANWPVDEVLAGWLEILAARIAVAIPIALALRAALRVQTRRAGNRSILVAGAILAGAMAGEALLAAANVPGARIDAWGVAAATLQWLGLSACAAGIYYLWMRGDVARARRLDHELARSRAEALRVRTELESLRQQIDPHFLFNTLATVRRLQELDAADGTRLLRHLVDYLDAAARAPDARATLGDEMDLARSHLAIVAIRMGGRLRVEIDVPHDLRACTCPPLTVATLVENAVKHGITPSPDGGTVSVHARSHGGMLDITVEDTGVGLSGSRPGYGGGGLGLANIRARLRALYGESASLALSANAPRGVRAVIRLPDSTERDKQ